MANLCSNCGANPCYHLCYNSPHYYSPERERADEPHYGDDDHRERYAGERIDGELEGRYADMDDWPEQEAMIGQQLANESKEGFRPNDDGTVTYISPTGGEHTYDPADVFKDTDDSLPF